MVVNITKFFSLDRINHFVEWLHEDHITNNEKTYVLSTVFSFFDFSEISNSSKYLAKLYDVRNKIKFVKNPIQLPSSRDRKSTRLNSSHVAISYAVCCLQ